MHNNLRRWKRLFVFCLGLFAGTAFCMKWMESDFWQHGEKFTIIGLEISYTKEKVIAILSGLDDHVRTILRYHLTFDFAFMAGVYPGIAALCMMAREKQDKLSLRKLLFIMASLQTIAWGCDVYENACIFKWINNPVIGDDFGLYHIIVAAKWIIALTGVLIAIPLSFKRKK